MYIACSMQKPVLLNIKHEELQESDGEEHYPDNAFNERDSDSDEHEVNHATTSEERHEESAADHVAKTEVDISPMMPFIVEAVSEAQIGSNIFECYLCHKSWKTAGTIICSLGSAFYLHCLTFRSLNISFYLLPHNWEDFEMSFVWKMD